MPPEPAARRLRRLVEAEAARLGFAALGVARPDAVGPAAARLARALADGHHGTMTWLADTAERRADPRRLMAEARSVVLLATSYAPEGDPLAVLARRDRGAISVHVGARDYHETIKGRLKELSDKLRARARTLGVPGDAKVFVDTAPLMEKPLAAAAGLGWQGKHTNLVSRAHGSWLFLGAVLTAIELEPDAPETDHCGSCRACLDICPTAAFPAPYRLDARRCISYLTIEHAGPIDRALRPLMGNRIYGCDDCLAVCPWNKFAVAARDMRFRRPAALDAPALADLARLDDDGFRRLFAGTAVKRIGRDRFVRNVAVAIGNSGEPALAAALAPLLADAAAEVRGAAVWALGRLVSPEAFAAERDRRRPGETDPTVLEEWTAS